MKAGPKKGNQTLIKSDLSSRRLTQRESSKDRRLTPKQFKNQVYKRMELAEKKRQEKLEKLLKEKERNIEQICQKKPIFSSPSYSGSVASTYRSPNRFSGLDLKRGHKGQRSPNIYSPSNF